MEFANAAPITASPKRASFAYDWKGAPSSSVPKVERAKNVVGPQVRKLRWERGLKQREIAARLQIAGWDADRATISKIESRLRCVADYELPLLARVLKVEVSALFAQ